MSHVATKWAFDQPEAHGDMKPSEWAILMVLADCHNPVHGCFPTQEYITLKTNLSPRTVRDLLAKLRARGLVDWEEAREANRRGANRYRLACEDGFQPAESAACSTGRIEPFEPAESAACSTGRIEPFEPAESDSLNRQNLPPNLVIEPVKEPVREREARARDPDFPKKEEAGSQPDAELEPAWQAFKAAWPDIALDSQELARKALARLTAAERRRASDRVAAYVAFHRERRGARRALPYAHVYLGEKRFDDLPPDVVAAAVAQAAEPEFKFLDPYGRAWWWCWFDFVARHLAALRRRDSVEAAELRRVESKARSRIGRRVEARHVREIEAVAADLVAVPVLGAEHAAWDGHLRAALGLACVLPRPDVADWIYVPTRLPGERPWPPVALAEGEDIEEILG